MTGDTQDILFVFLVNNLTAIARNQPVILPSGLADFIRAEVIESNGDLPFPSDLSDLLFVYEISGQNRF
ncbi:MAG: hypothetical protein IJ510_03905 [Selenomonadales bacterium]|nr:hypothetical protein [Selenomonadales bacterium]